MCVRQIGRQEGVKGSKRKAEGSIEGSSILSLITINNKQQEERQRFNRTEQAEAVKIERELETNSPEKKCKI